MEYCCCNKPFSTRDNKKLLMKCTSCKDNYHTTCVLPDKSDWSSDLNFKLSWLCSNCTKVSTCNQDSTSPEITDLKSHLFEESTKKSKRGESEMIVVPLDQVRIIIREEVQKVIEHFRESILDLKSEISTLKNSMEFISEKYDDISKKVGDINLQINYIPEMKRNIGDMDSKVKLLQQDSDMKDQWARRSNIEIIGVPQRRDENLVDLISKIAKVADFQLNPQTDIDFVSRVAPLDKNNKKPKPIIMRFISRYRKDDFLSRMRGIKEFRATDIGFSQELSRIYFNDHLTKKNKLLLQSAKKAASDKLFKYVWVRNCTIMMRKTDTSPVVHIGCDEDLKKIQ